MDKKMICMGEFTCETNNSFTRIPQSFVILIPSSPPPLVRSTDSLRAMVEHSDNSCTGPGSKDATKGESRKLSNEKQSNEKVEATQAGGETTRGSAVAEGRTTGHIADAPTQATDVTEGNRSATGPIIIGSGDGLDVTKKMDETIGGVTKVEDAKVKPMDKLDITALNNMERSQLEDEEETYHATTWKFWRRKKRRKRVGKRKGTKQRRTSRTGTTEQTRHSSATSKPSKKEELNPFNPGGPRLGADLSTIVTEAATTKNGPGLDTINEQQHLENEKKYRQLILEQRDYLARLREEINKKDEQLADAEAHRKRGLWQFLTGTYLAKTTSSILVMAIFYAGFVAVIGSIFSNLALMRLLHLFFTILAPICAWTPLLPSERSQSGWGVHDCGETEHLPNGIRRTAFSARVLNLETQLECGGTFVTRKHIVTSPSCLLVNGEPVSEVSSQIIVVHIEMNEPAQHYRFPSSFLDDKFHGAEIAIVEVKEGLQRHYPACIAHANVRIPKDLRTITPQDRIVNLTRGDETTNCQKTKGPRNIFDNCTIIITVSSPSPFNIEIRTLERRNNDWRSKTGDFDVAESFLFAPGDPIISSVVSNSSLYRYQYLIGVRRAAMNSDAETVEGKVDGLVLGVSIYFWGQFICEHTGVCNPDSYFHLKDGFRKYIEDGKRFDHPTVPPTCTSKAFDDVKNKLSALPRISKTEAADIRRKCGRGGKKLRNFPKTFVCCSNLLGKSVYPPVLHTPTVNFKHSRLYTTNDFVILVVERPLYDKGVICLPTREAALELEKKDVKLSLLELDQEHLIVKDQIDVKLKRVNCTSTKSCSYFDVETAKDRSELFDGTPVVYTDDVDGSEVIFLAGLNSVNRKRATDMLHLLDRICLLTGVCMDEFDTLMDIATQESFDTSEKSEVFGKLTMDFYERVEYNNSQIATNELFAQLRGDPPKGYLPELTRPVINYGVNMSTSQFVVGIGHLMGYPMDFGFGPDCSGAIISQRHVITADHCVDDLWHTPSRVYVMYGANCFNPIFSRHDHTTYRTFSQVPCGNSGQRIAYVKHIIYPKHQLWFKRATQFPGEFQYKLHNYAKGDFVILELRFLPDGIRPTSWSVRVLNLDTQLECGGAFVTRKHLITSPSCLLEMNESAQHYRFPSAFLDHKFHGAEIAIVEVKEGLQRHYPVCIHNSNAQLPWLLSTMTPNCRDDQMTNCMKTEGQRNILENCTIIITATSSTTFTSSPGDPIFYTDKLDEFLLGVRRTAKNSDWKTIDGKVDGMTMGVSIYFWGQFVCEHTGKYEPKKVCDGVFIAERHILASFNCFRTAVGPLCYDESCSTTNDFVILIVKRPLYDKGVICLPTKEMALELEKKDVKLAMLELEDEYLIVGEQVDVKLNRVNCTRSKSCSYFNVETAKGRSELIDGTPLVFTVDVDGSEVIFLAGLLNGRKYAKDNRKRATDILHLLDRICLLTGICMEEFDTLKGATNELFAQLSGDPPKGYSPEISRLTQEENEELQHICGKAAPSGVIISKRHVLTADHCVDPPLGRTPSRVFVMYGANCFNAMFSRHNHTTYNTPGQIVRYQCAKSLITRILLFRRPKTQIRDDKSRHYAAGDAILELQENLVFDSTTSPICMPKREQTYKQEILYIYGVGGSTNYTGNNVREMSMEGIVMRALFNNHSKELGRAETRIGRDEEYWLEVDEYREGMPAIDHGDSGGPWTRTSKDDRSVLVSVTSQGRGRHNGHNMLPFMSQWGPNLEREGDFICKWTGVCPKGIDGSRDKQATEIDVSLLSSALAWKPILPSEATSLRQTCGNSSESGDVLGWAVRIRNEASEVQCGGAFVTRRHIITSPACLMVEGAPIKELSQISVIYSSSNKVETPTHYRFPKAFADNQFGGASIAIVEVAEGLIGHSPICIPDFHHKLNHTADLWIDSDSVRKERIYMGHEMADCLKVEGAHTKNRDDCTYIFSANAGAGHGDFAKGSAIFQMAGSQYFLVGEVRERKEETTVEIIDYKWKNKDVLAVSVYYWSQFICEHTGACFPEDFYHIPPRFRKYIQDGERTPFDHAPPEECRVTAMKRVTNPYSSLPRITKAEASEIKRKCGRGRRYNFEYREHLYLARIFMADLCTMPYCETPTVKSTNKICDGVYISAIHILTSAAYFRTFKFNKSPYTVHAIGSSGKIVRAFGPLCYDEPCYTANDFVILVTWWNPWFEGKQRDVVCLPTRKEMEDIAQKDTKLAVIDFYDDGPIVKEKVDAKVKRINCASGDKSCSYFEVDATKSRSELYDGTPLVYTIDKEGNQTAFLAGLLVGKMNDTDERKVATDTMHMLERICLLSGVCMEEFETLTDIALHEKFATSERDKSSEETTYMRDIEFFNESPFSVEASLEVLSQLKGLGSKEYAPVINRLSKHENEELQHMCGKAPPRPVINYGMNMSDAQFVVGIGNLLNYPMEFGYGLFCSGVIISSRHVLTSDHCVDYLRYDPSRLVVHYGSNCVNPIFSRHNHTTYHTTDHVPCKNSQQKVAFVKHVITQKHQLYRSSLTTPTHFSRDEDEEEEDRPPTDRPLAIADFAILELRDELIFDANTSPICMPKHEQKYKQEILTIYGVGGETRFYSTGPVLSMEGIVTRATYNNETSNGDSGGPWVRENTDQRQVLVAVTSRGVSEYSVYRESSIKYLLFISPNLERQSDYICKWTGVCPEGIDAARDKQETNVDEVAKKFIPSDSSVASRKTD
uniref:Peptidase S1 domain-containing protein n=1 Tax=Pristionchus pacificus TaxID=54126 RepID=A0A8R1UQP8_PRIPA